MPKTPNAKKHAVASPASAARAALARPVANRPKRTNTGIAENHVETHQFPKGS
jgi:hypothetical protein